MISRSIPHSDSSSEHQVQSTGKTQIKAGEFLLTFTCLTFFPAVYLIGRMITQWLG